MDQVKTEIEDTERSLEAKSFPTQVPWFVVRARLRLEAFFVQAGWATVVGTDMLTLTGSEWRVSVRFIASGPDVTVRGAAESPRPIDSEELQLLFVPERLPGFAVGAVGAESGVVVIHGTVLLPADVGVLALANWFHDFHTFIGPLLG